MREVADIPPLLWPGILKYSAPITLLFCHISNAHQEDIWGRHGCMYSLSKKHREQCLKSIANTGDPRQVAGGSPVPKPVTDHYTPSLASVEAGDLCRDLELLGMALFEIPTFYTCF